MYKHYFTFENISIVLKLRLRSRLGSHLQCVCSKAEEKL